MLLKNGIIPFYGLITAASAATCRIQAFHNSPKSCPNPGPANEQYDIGQLGKCHNLHNVAAEIKVSKIPTYFIEHGYEIWLYYGQNCKGDGEIFRTAIDEWPCFYHQSGFRSFTLGK